MSDNLESLRRKIESAGELESIVRTMKAIAASNIVQYKAAVDSLSDYYKTIVLGIYAYFKFDGSYIVNETEKKNDKKIISIVFGSDLGLVGKFNEEITDSVVNYFKNISGRKEVWAVGERVYSRLMDARISAAELFQVPGSVAAITSLIQQIIIKSEEARENFGANEFYIFHNAPIQGDGFETMIQRWLPLDKAWAKEFLKVRWPSNNLPEVLGRKNATIQSLIREYLFVSLFRACAESMASENISRLESMQRAEKNIDELLEELGYTFHRLRQSSIDEELFDVVAGFEALKEETNRRYII